MSYREMVIDAGLNPDSDEGRQMACAIEEEERRDALENHRCNAEAPEVET